MAHTLIDLINLCTTLFDLLILARIVMSFIQVDRAQPAVKVIFDLTEPVLAPIRNLLPPMGMFDFSPMVAFLLVQVLNLILTKLVQSLF